MLSASFLLLLGHVATAALPYEARLTDGTTVQGAKLGAWDEAHPVPLLDGQAWRGDHPPRWLRAAASEGDPAPRAFVEWVGGDRLPGVVVASRRGDEQAFERLPSHLVVEGTLSADGRRPVRVAVASLRRVVWQTARTPRPFEPGTAWLRSGERLAFTAVRWDETAAALLTAEQVERIPFSELAELHLPAADAWGAYTQQLAELACGEEERLLTVETRSGARLTSSQARRRAPGPPAPAAPALLVQPAWSLDVLRVTLAEVRHWLSLAPHELPFSWLDPAASRQRHVFASPRPWRRDRNLEGEPLASSDRRFAWGFGVHAQHELEFLLPDAAHAIHTWFALDPRARDGGCVRARLLASRDGAPGPQTALFASPPLVGSRSQIDSGPVTLPAGARRRLSLIADMAHADRPAASDPFDIRDQCNWLEPLLLLDPNALAGEVRRRAAERIPAWEDWTVGPEAGARLASRWNEREQRFVSEIQPAAAALTIERRLRPQPEDRFLLLCVARRLHETNASRLRVFAGDVPLGEWDVPATKVGDEPDPLLVPLEKIPLAARAAPQIRIEQSAAGERGFVAWRELKLVRARPGEARLFEGLQRLPTTEPGGSVKSRLVRLPVARIPRLGEFRFLRFAWQKRGGQQIRLELRAGEKRVVYQVGSPGVGGAPLEFPAAWTSEVRDLFEDFGQRDVTLTEIVLESPDGEEARFDDLLLARNLRDFDQTLAAHPLADSLPLRRGWGHEMHGELLRQVSPDFNSNGPTRAHTVSLFARHGGRTAVVETDPPLVFASQVDVPAGLRSRLELTIGRRAASWKLVIQANGQTIHEQVVPPSSAPHWDQVSVDLTRFAGQTILLEPRGEGGGLWARLAVVSE